MHVASCGSTSALLLVLRAADVLLASTSGALASSLALRSGIAVGFMYLHGVFLIMN